jgi:uncharacterized protein
MSSAPLICKSEYVTMNDGVRLASSVWLKEDEHDNAEKLPALLTTTRYWRTTAFKQDQPEYQYFYPAAEYLLSQGYRLVAVDVRGTGASFGYRTAEIPPEEVEDSGELIHWVSQQPWCDGRVVSTGVSYTAGTALYSLIHARSALKLAVCRAPDFDGYLHLLAPGGIVNRWFIDAWGESSAAQDSNNAAALMAKGYSPPPTSGADNLVGVRPVDEDTDGTLLTMAIAEHRENFSVVGSENALDFIDDPDNPLFQYHRELYDPEYKRIIEQRGIPTVIRCGWHDGGTALGALSIFASFDAPMEVIIDPLNHSGNMRADPFLSEADAKEEATINAVWTQAVESSNQWLSEENTRAKKRLSYYTFGVDRWNDTDAWPLPNTKIQRWYFAADHRLSQTAPSNEQRNDIYQVNPEAGSGRYNRWHAQSRSQPIFFPDRRDEDKKLLVYETPPLENDLEITGHPVVNLSLRSTATDGQFFVFLEVVDSDGCVRWFTEGQLRGLHRKVSAEAPPYKMFGPYHSFKKQDAEPMVPGEVTELAFDLFPISIVLKKGQRLRVAIAGADKDVFSPIPGCEAPELTVERNAIHRSYIDLPVIGQ